MAEKEYIEREALSQAILDLPPKMDEQGYGWLGRRGVWQMVNDFPAADVRPVVRAQIIDMRYVEEDGEWKCSRCGWQYTLCVCGKDVTSKIHFCPRCGADMRPTSMSGAKEES